MNRAVMEFVCDNEISIFDFLKEKLSFKSKNNVKGMIVNGCVYVNDVLVNKVNFFVSFGDRVLVILKQIRYKNGVIDIIYEDDYFIGINKPSGLLSISTSSLKEITAYSIVREYVKKNCRSNKLFILHRLDRDTSGILLFCRDEKLKNSMQNNWDSVVFKRGYLAIVIGKLKNKSGVIKSYLYEDKNYVVKSSNNPKSGKLAITNYEVIKSNKKYSLLQIFLDTGRKNQIRVHMNEIGTSILGDRKYGSVKSDRLYLHSNIFGFIHPVSKEKVIINCSSNFNNI